MALKNQNPQLLIPELCDLLDKIAKLWQVKDYDPSVNSILLSEWIMDEYQHHDLDLVRLALSKPPLGNDREWRLTPDTLKNWIELTRIKREKQKALKESRERQEMESNAKPLSPEVEREVFGYLNQLVKTVPALKKGDIQNIVNEDRRRIERPKASGYVPNPELVLIKQRMFEATKKRGLHECNFNDLKAFQVLGETITARSEQEANEVWQEVWGSGNEA